MARISKNPGGPLSNGQDPSASPEAQARIEAIAEAYDSFFHDLWICELEDGEVVLCIAHFFLTGDMKKHIEELADPFAVEFTFEKPPSDLAAPRCRK